MRFYFCFYYLSLVYFFFLLSPYISVIGIDEKTKDALELETESKLCEIENNLSSKSNNKECLSKEKEKSSYSKYSEQSNQWTKYLNSIKIAQEEYISEKSKSDRILNPCNNSSCSCYFERIRSDLKIFLKDGINKNLIEQASPRGTFYQIIDRKLYRETDCKFPARCSGVEYFLLQILRDEKLPDMEFIINVSDYPQVENWTKNKLPVFSFSKTPDFLDIFYPAWSFWEGGPSISIFPRGLGRWDLRRKSLIKISKELKWSSKKSLAFFRGSRTSAERDPLVLVSRSHPNLADAKYTKNQAWRSDADTLGEPAASEVTLEEHCNYKYLFNYRGVAASFRFKHLFLCNSLVVHVGNEWEEFFYDQLKPWIHYVPLSKKSTEQEIRGLIEFLQEHDEVAQKIAERGFKFIKAKLKLYHVLCYWKELLLEYSKLIKYQVTGPRSNFIHITK